MLDALPSGIGASSQARAALAALSAHIAVVIAAAYATSTHLTVPTATPTRDTVRIELSKNPNREGVPRSGSLPAAPRFPPARPVMPVDQPAPALPLSSTRDLDALAAIRDAVVRDPSPSDTASEGTKPLPVSAIDDLPGLLADLKPRYPAELQAANVNGEVVVEYVVDGSGRVAASSIRIVRSDHPAFTRSVREALLSARFSSRPAGGKSRCGAGSTDDPVSN